MADTPATRALVTAAYTQWQKRLNQYNDKVPGVTKADVSSAYKQMQKYIRDWEAPSAGETPKQAKQDRTPKRKSWWPKFK